jgi:hypothetical protein
MRPAVRRRLLAVFALAGAVLMMISTTSTSAAAAHCAPGQEPEFVLGFAFMKSQLGDTMGEPLECEHANPDNGDTLQQTSTGLAFYRKSTNTPTFTDGWRHWGWTAAGMVFWTGDSIDPPEDSGAPPDSGSSATPTPAPAVSGTNFYGFPCETESNPRPVFTADVTDLSLVEVIVPAGNQAGTVIKQHSFIVLGGDLPDSPMGPAAPVYAPVDSRFITGSYYRQGGANEYLLFFEASCEVVYKFDHIRWIVPELRALLPSEPASSSSTTFFANPVEVTAGQLIGYTPGTGEPGGGGPFDFGLFNSTFSGTFANQARYEGGGYDQLWHADCPYDYYAEPQRSAYLALFGTPGRVRVGAATCRPISRDVPGALAGAWFAGGGFEAAFAIATTLANEVRIGGPGFTMWVDPGEPTWTDPAAVTTEHCYQQERGGGFQYAYLRLLSPTELAVANGAGACPGALPGGYLTVVR